MSEKHFCPSCGEEVETVTIAYEKRQEVCCLYCGFPLKMITPHQFSSEKSILIVDDSKLLVELLRDYFESNKLAKNIYCSLDGGAFLCDFVEKLRFREEVGLVILDILMPVMSGVNAAIAMRSIEKGFAIDRIPILFFSAKRADEQLVNVMKYCAPAHYICKEVANDQKELCERVYKVANNLLTLSKQQQGEPKRD
jgi:CheY-like chemotaxis protein